MATRKKNQSRGGTIKKGKKRLQKKTGQGAVGSLGVPNALGQGQKPPVERPPNVVQDRNKRKPGGRTQPEKELHWGARIKGKQDGGTKEINVPGKENAEKWVLVCSMKES